MATFNWRPFLEQYSRQLLADRRIRSAVPRSVVQAAWMGFDPASAAELSQLECRIGAELPNSYRLFLATSNGWRQSGGFIYAVYPCRKVEWFRTNNQDWIEAYVDPAKDQPPLPVEEHCVYGDDQDPCRFRVEYLQSTLLISAIGDSAVYLLNPELKTPSGEWEAWFFANWHPGAVRYRSFWDLMQAEYHSFVGLRDLNERRYFPEDGIETLRPKLPGLIRELAEKAHQHRRGQQQRALSRRSARGAYTDGIIEALHEAEAAVKETAARELSPDALLGQLTDLATDLERRCKAATRPNACGVDKRDGRAEGNREAAGIICWFVNQPQN
jgi:hypothetical protein